MTNPKHDTSHGACGKTWKQRGNITGHCSGCHETFEGEKLFDAHRYYTDEAQTIRGCKDPQTMTHNKYPLKQVNGAWKSSEPSPFSAG